MNPMIHRQDVERIIKSYQRGHHDGLEVGRRDEDFGRHDPDDIRVGARLAYKIGYDAGITAHCEEAGLDEDDASDTVNPVIDTWFKERGIDPSRIDAVEVHGCIEIENGVVEQSDDNPSFYGVYAHYAHSAENDRENLHGLDWIADFPTEAEAEEFASTFPTAKGGAK